jgi:probable rRNA maturation factor
VKIAFWTRGARRPAAEKHAARGVRAALGRRRGGEMNVVWTSRGDLRKMNVRFRKTDRFTDVIAFRHEPAPGERRRRAADTPFGDLYIAVDQARKNARRFGVTYNEEIVRLAVHGTLHLLGHTDYTPVPRARMWAAQEPLVRRVMARARLK